MSSIGQRVSSITRVPGAADIEEDDVVVEEDNDDELIEAELVDKLVEGEEVVIEEDVIDELFTDDSTAYIPAAAIITIITTTAMTIARRPIARLIFKSTACDSTGL